MRSLIHAYLTVPVGLQVAFGELEIVHQVPVRDDILPIIF
jgi:hypothetical protein